VAGVVVATVCAPAAARSAAAQVYAPFVLVAGLILVGLVADGDGLFEWVGHRLAGLAPNGIVLFAGSVVATAVVTAVLNLDTAVVFLTPVIVHAARSRGVGETPFVVSCVLVANAGSLPLPGSNLTNLIVIGHLRLSGGEFLHRMALPWVAAVVVTAVVVGVAERRRLRASARPADRPGPPVLGVGLAAVVVSTVLVVVLRAPALPVAAVGVVAIGVRLHSGREHGTHVRKVLGVPVLVALFGLAVALGTLGREWSGPARLLAHLDAVGTAAVAAASTVLVNNLPAAALLAARTPPHPFALLIGLDIGPNLFVTGSLAWVLWWRTVRDSGGTPPTTRAVVLGLLTVPVAMAAALAAAGVTGPL
jgi:arsenical pump membrane protein